MINEATKKYQKATFLFTPTENINTFKGNSEEIRLSKQTSQYVLIGKSKDIDNIYSFLQ